MKILLSSLRYVFISCEFVVCLLGLLVYTCWPLQLTWVSLHIGSQAEVLKYFAVLPIGLIVYDSNCVREILTPKADTWNLLQKWNLYFEFKIGCIIGLLYGILFCLLGVICFFFDWNRPTAAQSAVLLTSVVGAITVAASFYLHGIKMEEIFRQYTNPIS